MGAVGGFALRASATGDAGCVPPLWAWWEGCAVRPSAVGVVGGPCSPSLGYWWGDGFAVRVFRCFGWRGCLASLSAGVRAARRWCSVVPFGGSSAAWSCFGRRWSRSFARSCFRRRWSRLFRCRPGLFTLQLCREQGLRLARSCLGLRLRSGLVSTGLRPLWLHLRLNPRAAFSGRPAPPPGPCTTVPLVASRECRSCDRGRSCRLTLCPGPSPGLPALALVCLAWPPAPASCTTVPLVALRECHSCDRGRSRRHALPPGPGLPWPPAACPTPCSCASVPLARA